MLSLDDFEQLRRKICASGRASGGDDLLGMEIDFDNWLQGWAYADGAPACGRTWLFSAIKARNG